MAHHDILLSSGSFPWLGLKKSFLLIKDINYDGLEILPTRKITRELKKIRQKTYPKLSIIKGIHQSWRLDNGFDREYGINFLTSLFYRVIRFIFFPDVPESNKTIELLCKELNAPITIHRFSERWTLHPKNKFSINYNYEIFNNSPKPDVIKAWLEMSRNNIAIDTRDDQSLLWAKKNGFNTWKTFWRWINLKKIKNVQLTLIGRKGIRNIFQREKSITEDQFIWLNKNSWKGSVTVEVNPVNLFMLSRGDVKHGLRSIAEFIMTTLDNGKKWSK